MDSRADTFVKDGLSYRSASDSMNAFTMIIVFGAFTFLLMFAAVIGYTCMAFPVGKKKQDLEDEESMETAISAKSRLNNSKKSLVLNSARQNTSKVNNRNTSTDSEKTV